MTATRVIKMPRAIPPKANGRRVVAGGAESTVVGTPPRKHDARVATAGRRPNGEGR